MNFKVDDNVEYIYSVRQGKENITRGQITKRYTEKARGKYAKQTHEASETNVFYTIKHAKSGKSQCWPASKIVGTYVPDSDEDDDGGSGASSKKRSSDASENESKAENAKKSKK